MALPGRGVADLRKPVLRAYVARGLLGRSDAKDMLAYPVGVGVSADVYRDSALASRMFSLPSNGIKLARTGAVSLAEIYRPCS